MDRLDQQEGRFSCGINMCRGDNGESERFGEAYQAEPSKAIDGCYDGKMVNRLTTEVSAIIMQCKTGNAISFGRFSFCGLSGFDFNINSPMRESISFSPAVTQADGELIVSLPDIVIPEQLHFPSGASTCEININISMISLKDNLIAQ